MKSKKLLEEFNKYCKQNPEQRFWQSLRNWSGYNALFVSRKNPTEVIDKDLEDTFYW